MVTPLAPQQLAGILPRQAVRMVQDALQAAGWPDADYDARELLRIAAGKDPRLLFDPLTRPQAECLAELAAQRMQRVPLQYLAGEWDFLGLTFKVGPGVLCPRADSEVVCETAIELLQQMGKPEPRVLDLCAGTGCLGIGIRHFVPSASVTCVEKSPQALQYLTALVKECGELGFKEVLLDQFCYPADTTGVANTAADPAQVLADFAENLRSALPEGTALSVVVRSTDSLSVEQMAELFDRLYVPSADTLAAVRAALPEGYDPETRVVAMTAEAPQSGSYVIVS